MRLPEEAATFVPDFQFANCLIYCQNDLPAAVNVSRMNNTPMSLHIFCAWRA